MYSSHTSDLFEVMQVLVTDRRHQVKGAWQAWQFRSYIFTLRRRNLSNFLSICYLLLRWVVRSAGSLLPRVYGVPSSYVETVLEASAYTLDHIYHQIYYGSHPTASGTRGESRAT